MTGAELYGRFLAGDDESFTTLVKTYRNALTGFIANIICNETDAEDIAIDAFAILMSRKKKLNENVSFKTFLFSIGKNLSFKYLRKNRKKPLLLNEAFEDGWVITGSPSVEDDFFSELDKKRLSACMRQLKPDHRSVLHLLYFEGLSYAEAGQVMGKTEGQIRGLASRAREKLKIIFEGNV